MASGCLTRGFYPNAEKGNLIKSDSVLEFSRVLFLINSIINAQERLRQTKLKQAFRLEISVYSRSDKHLISKMEKPKVAKSKLELFGVSLLKFLFVFIFQTVCLGFSDGLIFHFISFLILHLKRWAVGFLQSLVQWTAFTLPLHPVFFAPSVEGAPVFPSGPRLPSLSTLFSSPPLSRVRLSSPLSSGFFYFSSPLS